LALKHDNQTNRNWHRTYAQNWQLIGEKQKILLQLQNVKCGKSLCNRKSHKMENVKPKQKHKKKNNHYNMGIMYSLTITTTTEQKHFNNTITIIIITMFMNILRILLFMRFMV